MQPTKEEKQLVLDRYVEFCATDCRPLGLIAGTGFKNFGQCLLDLGLQSKSRIMVEDLYVHTSTAGRRVEYIAEQCRVVLKEELQKILAQNIWVQFSTDIWTDDYDKV